MRRSCNVHSRFSYTAFLLLPATTFGQWWLGAIFATTNARFEKLELGVAVRSQYTVDPYWTAIASIGSTIPTSTKVDLVSGGPRQLQAGPTIQTRHVGTAFETSQFLSFGMIRHIAPSRRERRRITPYFGLTTGPTTRTSTWNVNVTTIASGETQKSRGTSVAFAWPITTFAGIRTKAIKGFYLVEALPVFTKSIETNSNWSSLYALNFGYVRRIGRS